MQSRIWYSLHVFGFSYSVTGGCCSLLRFLREDLVLNDVVLFGELVGPGLIGDERRNLVAPCQVIVIPYLQV